MSGLDRDIIDARISRIRTAALKLNRYKDMPAEEFTGNSDYLDLAERNLEVAIEAMLDIGNHIIATLGFEKPEDYYDIFIILGKHKVLPFDFAEKIAPLAGLRNRIIHDYLKIDHQLLLANIKERLPDFEEYAKSILLFTEKSG